jgi:WXXGXW repeat (2 copies)
MPRPFTCSLLVPLAAALLLSACVVAPYPRRVVYTEPVAAGSYESQEVIVGVAPPPAYVEVVPSVPYAGAVWIGGYWGWSGGRHSWVPGRWDRPRPGYRWQPHAWSQQGGRWHLHGGGWVR